MDERIKTINRPNDVVVCAISLLCLGSLSLSLLRDSSICLSVSLTDYLSVRLSSRPSIYLSIYFYLYIFYCNNYY